MQILPPKNSLLLVHSRHLTKSITAIQQQASTQTILSLVGVVGTDDVSLTGEAINFADPNVANNILVSITAASLAGTKAFNYSLSLVGSPTANANITAKELTVAGSFTANNKVYDGNTTASFNAKNLSFDRCGWYG
jgi:hypothetical protein